MKNRVLRAKWRIAFGSKSFVPGRFFIHRSSFLSKERVRAIMKGAGNPSIPASLHRSMKDKQLRKPSSEVRASYQPFACLRQAFRQVSCRSPPESAFGLREWPSLAKRCIPERESSPYCRRVKTRDRGGIIVHDSHNHRTWFLQSSCMIPPIVRTLGKTSAGRCLGLRELFLFKNRMIENCFPARWISFFRFSWLIVRNFDYLCAVFIHLLARDGHFPLLHHFIKLTG